MRFPVAALFFICAGFIFLATFAVGSLLIDEIDTAFDNEKPNLDSSFTDTLTLLKDAFGIISAIFLVTGVLLAFILQSLSDEPEYYYRE